MSLRLTLSLRLTAAAACLGLLTGCPDDGNEDGDGDSGTSTGDAATDTTGTPMTGADTTTDGGESSGSTSEPGTDSGSTTSEEVDSSSSGSMTEGICVGFDQVGNIVSVLGLDGANVGGMCDSTPAGCGGDLVGTWEFDNTCGQDEIPNPFADCDGSTFEVQIDDLTGSMTFGDDGSFAQMSMTSSTVTLSVTPDACFGFNCAAFEAQLQGDNPNWTCEDNAPDCDCELMQMGMTDVMGTYETDGNVVTVTVDGTAVDFEYCAEGDRLDLWQPLTDFTVTETACFDETDCEAELMDTHDAYACVDPMGG